MSVENMSITSLTTQQYNKPSLSVMLPDPTKYSLQSNSNTGSSCSNTSFSLPPIRELLKSTSPQPAAQQAPPQVPQVQQVPQQHQIQHQQQQQQQQPQQPQSQLYQPQPTTYHSPFSNPISPIANTPDQQLRQPLPHSNSFQGYYSHQPPQFQQHQMPQMYQQGRITPTSLPLPQSQISETRSSSSSPISEDAKEKLNTRKKRQNLPRQTTLILLSWLSEHLDRPYPNSREKYELLMKTRLTIQQLDNWFINARRRKINILRKLKENDQNIALTF